MRASYNPCQERVLLNLTGKKGNENQLNFSIL